LKVRPEQQTYGSQELQPNQPINARDELGPNQSKQVKSRWSCSCFRLEIGSVELDNFRTLAIGVATQSVNKLMKEFIHNPSTER
jgi:hypothetical protein